MTAVLSPPVDPSPPPGRPLHAFPGLDAVRAAGASAVLATHVAFQTGRSVHGPMSGTLARFDIGVALFFVLSGFLLFRPFAQAAVSDRSRWPRTVDYLWRRGLRILPAYWLAVVACLLLLPANAGQRGPGVWLRHLTLTQVYSPGLQRHGLTQTWSLCTEVAFYLLLPVLAVVVLGRRGTAAGRRPLVALAAVAAVSVAWQVVTTRTSWFDLHTAGQWLPGYLDWFACGMALALIQVRLVAGGAAPWMHRLAELARSTGTCWGTSLALFAVATSPVAGPRSLEAVPTTWEAVLKNLLYGACALLVLLPLVLGPQHEGHTVRALGRRPVQLLGEISYGIFLWHLLVLETAVRVLHQQLFTGSWLLVFSVTWVGSVGVAAVSYVVVERPALRLKDRRFARGRRSGSSADQTSASAVTQSA
ncbi:MAG: acyltransferase 3 [Frankiales bacterium]|nr:acyltransferase 3 [Frankiales bacterium]